MSVHRTTFTRTAMEWLGSCTTSIPNWSKRELIEVDDCQIREAHR